MGVAREGGAGRTARPVTIYVANEGGNTVTPIRAASNRAGRPIRVGPGPALIAISPDGQTAYVVGHGGILSEAASRSGSLATPFRWLTVAGPD
jgi:DNA-binding beta-propeller fold protein YncE